MPSIRLSNKLKEEIKNNASLKFTDSVKKAKDNLPEDFYSKLADEVYNLHILQHNFESCPAGWKERISGLSGYIKGQVDGQEYKYLIIKNITTSYNVLSIRELVDHGRLEFSYVISPTLFNIYHTHQVKLVKKLQEQKEFTSSISQILTRCTTLKQFLKLWPQGESLIPKYILTQEHEPKEKKPELEVLDKDLLNKLSVTLVKQTILK